MALKQRLDNRPIIRCVMVQQRDTELAPECNSSPEPLAEYDVVSLNNIIVQNTETKSLLSQIFVVNFKTFSMQYIIYLIFGAFIFLSDLWVREWSASHGQTRKWQQREMY